jgi:hypothetical protein
VGLGCASWRALHRCRYRVAAPSFRLTRDFLAVMLRAHRPTLSMAASSLQRRNFIS